MIKYITVFSALIFSPLAACASTPDGAQPVPRLKPPTHQTAIPLGVNNQSDADQSTRFNAWKRDFIKRALAKGYDSTLLLATIGQATLNPKA
ncbi:MAG: hypothetical protein L3J05_02900, partial [Robiginitomaculum sp.]|nr:hypothetical protein [Robiginitomaculum sp.]